MARPRFRLVIDAGHSLMFWKLKLLLSSSAKVISLRFANKRKQAGQVSGLLFTPPANIMIDIA